MLALCGRCITVPRIRSAPLPLVGRGWGWGSQSGHDKSIVPRQRQVAREMRSAPTEAERRLWWHLRHRLPTRGTHFRRQVRIGRYIVDFACHARRVVIEVDTPSGTVSYPAPPARSDAAPPRYGAVPALGEHTAKIWAEFMPHARRK